MKRITVGVLMGGKSIEREVSFNSGRTICDHLDTARYRVIPLFQHKDGALYILPWKFLYRGKIADFEHRLSNESEHIRWDDIKTRIDFVYIALHGRFAEDGCVQAILELFGIPYLGSGIFASALGMDKIIQKKILRMNNIAVPRDSIMYPHELSLYKKNPTKLQAVLRKADLDFPVIVKPHKEGSSLGITVVTKLAELYPALEKAATISPGCNQAVLIEEKLDGMEFSCITIRDYTHNCWLPLPPTEIVLEKNAAFFDYEQKYMPGRATKFTPPRRSPDIINAIQKTCVRATEALEFSTISRIDGFVTNDNRIVIVDPNTLSGMAPSSFLFREAAELNMNHTDLINHLIETELHQYGMLEDLLLQEKKKARTMKAKKIRISVLMGGQSNEREISLESGRNITYKLSPQTYIPIPIFVTRDLELFKLTNAQLVRNTTKEITKQLDTNDKIAWADLPTIADFVFIGLHGGQGEDGTIQGTLEMLGLPYNGSSILTSSLCIDKYKSAQFLAHSLKDTQFVIPEQLVITRQEWHTQKNTSIKKIIQQAPFPIIVKPPADGCSIMVYKVTTEEELISAINTIFEHTSSALIQEYVTGTELTVGIIGNENPQALPPSQAISVHDILSIEEKFLPGAGENQTPAPLPEKSLTFVKHRAEIIYTTLGCAGYARLDCFYQSAQQSPTGTERLIFIEMNTLPAMTPATCLFHQAAEIGMKPMDVIDRIIMLGFEKHTNQAYKNYHKKEHISCRSNIP